MKNLVAGFLTTVMLTATGAVEAHGHRHAVHGGWHSYRPYNPTWWVAPAIIGGVVTYAATRPYVEQTIVVQQPQVVLQPNQVVIDGVVYTKQIMIVNGVQQEVLMRQ